MGVTILFIWTVEPDLRSYIKSELSEYLKNDLKLIFLDPYSDEEAEKYIEHVDMIVGWRPQKELLQKAINLQLFNNPGAGIQHLVPLFKELNNDREKPIILTNCHGNSYFTAQHAVGLLLAVTNKIILHHNWMREGKWRTGDEEGKSIPLKKKTIGLLGYGAINKKVHKFLRGFEVSFVICKKTVMKAEKDSRLPYYSLNQLHDFLQLIDVLIIAVPLTKETKGLIARKELELLGSDSVLINVGRGEVIDQNDLFIALKDKKISGAGLDVWYNYRPNEQDGKKYPYDNKNPFHKLDNVVMSPHRGASPMDNLERWNDVLYNIKTLFERKNNFKNIVNLELEY